MKIKIIDPLTLEEFEVASLAGHAPVDAVELIPTFPLSEFRVVFDPPAETHSSEIKASGDATTFASLERIRPT